MPTTTMWRVRVVRDEDLEETASPCPPWCVSLHDDDRSGARVHRGLRRVADLRARRITHTADGSSASVEDTQFTAGLVRYGSDDTTWLRVETRTGEPLEISIEDANRWIVLMGSAMVDESVRES